MGRPHAQLPRLLLVCACALAGAYLSASGLLRLNEVFFHPGGSSPFLHGAAVDQRPQEQEQVPPPPPPPVYDRLVLVLIDALRADMVLGSGAVRSPSVDDGRGGANADGRPKSELNERMPYARRLVASGEARAYVGHASVPTVTMPRLKALLTGRAPAFIDVLKNFNSAALGDDENLVALLRAAGKRLVFYGDDTWLKLFPAAFARSDGTSGFFTRDTVEVDDNVTRHLTHELDPTMRDKESRDWDVLLLHYLGLDHVGHLRGPRSPLMAQKLSEMDELIERIHESVKAQDARRRKENAAAQASLVLICSDHGMSEVGNHGGATLEEASALLMFLSGDGMHLKTEKDAASEAELRRRQVDLVPTIASLFGLRLPLLSTGVMLHEVVEASTRSHPRTFDETLYANVQQLRKLGEIKMHASAFSDFDARYRSAIHQLYQRVVLKIPDQGEETEDHRSEESEKVVDTVLTACKELQEMLARSDGSEYDLGMISAGMTLLLVSSAAAAVMGWSILASKRRNEASAIVFTGVPPSSGSVNLPMVVLLIGSVLQIVSLSSSSSIENEHATAFFLLTTLLLAQLLHLFKRRRAGQPWRTESAQLLLLLVITRALRARNQVINFGRLNGLTVDTTAPGNEFATDDSLSILSTAPLVPASIISPASWVVWIGIAVLFKSAIVVKAITPGKFTAEYAAGTALFLVGMAAVAGAKATSEDHEQGESWAMWQLNADSCARIVYAVSALLVLLSVLSTMTKAHKSLSRTLADMTLWLLVSLVQRGSHLPSLFLVSAFLLLTTWWLVSNHRDAASEHSTAVLLAGLGVWIAQAAFFSLGNSHLVTTVDISQSYLGLTDYSQGIVGLLTFLSAFSGPLVGLSSIGQWVRVVPSAAVEHSSSETAALAIVTLQVVRFMVYT
jgi:ethanolaminephosphotransferase